MSVLQVPPTSLVHKMATKDYYTGQTFYITLSLHMYGGGNINLDKDMEKPGSSDHFPKGTGCKSWFFRMSTALN